LDRAPPELIESLKCNTQETCQSPNNRIEAKFISDADKYAGLSTKQAIGKQRSLCSVNDFVLNQAELQSVHSGTGFWLATGQIWTIDRYTTALVAPCSGLEGGRRSGS
jgi:hypothetical protein